MKKPALSKGRRGKLIVIDGLDGSGKATQTQMLVEALRKQGRKVVTFSFPQYQDNHLGRFLRECLDGKHGDFIGLPPKLASLGYALDRFETRPKIEESLKKGNIVVLDRYVSSNLLHQGAKPASSKGRRELFQWLTTLEHEILGAVRPDRIIYLDVPLDVSLQLMRKRAVEQGRPLDQAEADAEHLKKAKAAGRELGAFEGKRWQVVQCGLTGRAKHALPPDALAIRSREDIHAEVLALVKKVL